MLTRRRVDLNVTLGSGTGSSQPTKFVETGGAGITLSGLRTSVEIANWGLPVGCEAFVRVWGVRQSIMNQLSTLGIVFNLVPNNTLSIAVGDDDSLLGGRSTIFNGTIYYAYGEYSNQPDVPFVMLCKLLGSEQVTPAKPKSYTGSTDVATVVKQIAGELGLGFENNGVDAKVARPYLPGSLVKQISAICRAGRALWAVVDGKVVIWPRGKNREDSGSLPVVSPDNGMIGYPAFTQQGIIVKTVFDPQITVGKLIQVESSILAGIGQAGLGANFPTQWAVNKIDLRLESELPNGDWMMTIYAYNPGYAKTIIPPGK